MTREDNNYFFTQLYVMQIITTMNFCPYYMYYYGAQHFYGWLLSIVISYCIKHLHMLHKHTNVYINACSCNIFLFSDCNRAACAVHIFNIVELEVHNVCKFYMLLP